MRAHRHLLPFLAAIAGCAPATRADAPAPAAAPASCWDAATTTLETIACAQQDLDALEALLQRVADGVAEVVPASSSGAFRASMRAWTQLRNADCAIVGSFFEGGSIRPVQEAVCRADRTRERILFLAPMLCPGAGMAGPCEAAGAAMRDAEAIRGPG